MTSTSQRTTSKTTTTPTTSQMTTTSPTTSPQATNPDTTVTMETTSYYEEITMAPDYDDVTTDYDLTTDYDEHDEVNIGLLVIGEILV